MKKILENKKLIIILILPLIIIILLLLNQTKAETIIEEPIIVEEQVEETPTEKTIRVDIKGEVENPGVYELKENDRVIEAINISGGLTKKADTTLINLSKTLKDEMVIIIYNKDKIEELRKNEKTTKTVIEYIEKECICPDDINDACISNETISEQTETKINLNTASLKEITSIPGIGESKAKAIIEYREENGTFNQLEDITKVSGIGNSTFETIKEYITI